MPEELENQVPSTLEQSPSEKDSPARCGTMLMYAGIIQLHVEDEPLDGTDVETDGPIFI